MATTAEIEAAFASIPTVNVSEVVRVVTPDGFYNAEVLITFADGSRNIAFTDASGVRIIRIGKHANLVHISR